MRLGILTFQETTNYGALLQATAMYKAFIGLGVEAEIINYECECVKQRELPQHKIKSLKRWPIELLCYLVDKKKFNKMEEFKRQNCKLSDKRYTKETVKETNDIYDIFVSGSDMIWELNVTGQDTTYYLDFVSDDKKKFSCSSSFGYDEVPQEYWTVTKKWLSKYQAISVREIEGANIVKNMLGMDVPVTADPTLLLSGEEWRTFCKPYEGVKKYVLVYFEDKNGIVMSSAKLYAKTNGCDVVLVSNSIKGVSGVKMIRDASVEQFLWLIDHAECIYTASYHGVLFSINFSRPFYYYNRAHQGRIHTIIKELGLESRNIDYRGMREDIDWNLINNKITSIRKETLDYMSRIITL